MILLTEDLACGAIMDFERVRRNFCLPRYTPSRWWECDVFELTKAGFFREYEIKLTLADFKNDAKKSRDIRGTDRKVVVEGERLRWVCDQERKHDLLSKGDTRGPAEFFFVTPPDLIPREILPQWAGLIELVDLDEKRRPSVRWLAKTVVSAPRLHETKAAPALRADALGACYYRFHDLARAMRDRTTTPLEWADDQPPAVECEPCATP